MNLYVNTFLNLVVFFLFSMGLGELVCRHFLIGDVVVYLYQLVDVAFIS